MTAICVCGAGCSVVHSTTGMRGGSRAGVKPAEDPGSAPRCGRCPRPATAATGRARSAGEQETTRASRTCRTSQPRSVWALIPGTVGGRQKALSVYRAPHDHRCWRWSGKRARGGAYTVRRTAHQGPAHQKSARPAETVFWAILGPCPGTWGGGGWPYPESGLHRATGMGVDQASEPAAGRIPSAGQPTKPPRTKGPIAPPKSALLG